MSDREFNAMFARNLQKLMADYDMNKSDLAKRLGVSVTTICSWYSGEKTPRMQKVDAMCEVFHCQREDLLSDRMFNGEYYVNRETADIAQRIYEDPNLRALFDTSKDLSPADMKMLAELARKFKGDAY